MNGIEQRQLKKRKSIALAFAGASGRAVAYIGMIEVFLENNIPIDMIAACSSATLVACAYACGNLEEFKKRALSLNTRELLELFGPSFKGGMFSFEKLEKWLEPYIPAENIEDLKIPIVIVASDLVEGKEVILAMGNIKRAIRASCSLPGVFEPVVWGDKILIDGGLFNIIPVEAAKRFGADLTIGIRVKNASNKHIFSERIMNLKQGYNVLKTPFVKVSAYAKNLRDKIFGMPEAKIIDTIKLPHFISILGKAIDYAIEERKKDENTNCDLIIDVDVDEFGRVDADNFNKIYSEGRRAALKALPQIRALMLEDVPQMAKVAE